MTSTGTCPHIPLFIQTHRHTHTVKNNKIIIRWLNRQNLSQSLTTWVQTLGPTWWAEKANSLRLSSNSICTAWHTLYKNTLTQKHTNKYVNNCLPVETCGSGVKNQCRRLTLLLHLSMSTPVLPQEMLWRFWLKAPLTAPTSSQSTLTTQLCEWRQFSFVLYTEPCW